MQVANVRAWNARAWDVVVVGGGPAGLATAIAARQQGLETLVVDRRRGDALDKPCGEGLMPDGCAALRRLGVPLRGGTPLDGIRYRDGETVAEARFAEARGLGLRRIRLHAILTTAAEHAGVTILRGVGVAALTPEPEHAGGWRAVETDDGAIRTRFIVGADGLRSRIRALAGLEGRAARQGPQRFGVRRHYRLPAGSDHRADGFDGRFVEVDWQRDTEAYVTPVEDDEVGVAILWRGQATGGFDALLAGHPTLAGRLEDAEPISRDAGCGPLRQRVRSVVRDNLALVGDASGYVDAITGEGLALAFQQAEALGHALGTGDLRAYAAAHRRIGFVADRMTHLVLALARNPAVRRRAITALARRPSLFTRLLAVHTRESPPHQAIIPVLRLIVGL